MRTIKYYVMLVLALSSCSIRYDDAIEYVDSASIVSQELNADSISLYSAAALRVWNETSWKRSYDNKTFFEYVLPPYVASEPVEYYWRNDIPKKLHVNTDEDISVLASRINNAVYVNLSTNTYGNAMLGYSRAMDGTIGKCNDRSMLLTMALRAYGIPSSYDEIPYWGSNNNGHTATSVVLPDDRLLVFQNVGDRGDSAIFANKIPKVFSRRYSILKDELYRHRDKASIPEFFKDFRKEDVTGRYPINSTDVVLDVSKEYDGELAYLAVFSPEGWVVVDYSEIRRGEVKFDDVGTGVSCWGVNPVAGDYIGEGIIYLPCIYVDRRIEPLHDVILVSDSGVESVHPDKENRITVSLTRKYPLLNRIKGYVSQMNSGVFECADDPDFSDATIMFRVADAKPYMQSRAVDYEAQYVRYRKSRGDFSIAEIQVKDNMGNELESDVFVEEFMKDLPDLQSVSDGNPLTYLTLPASIDTWVGLKLKRRERIGTVEFAPRNDDNNIIPGQMYELFYWEGKWISLGKQVAEDYEILYDEVPEGALLWLCNLSTGREERPFLYKNGKQVWF